MKIFYLTIAFLFSKSVFADFPRSWQMNFQDPASPIMEKIVDLHDMLFFVTVSIVLIVTMVLIYTCVRFSRKRNRTASKTTHNTLIEIVWTAIPVLILIVIAFPSFKTLRYIEKVDNPELTIKVVGHQWYWEYQYPDNGGFSFDSYIVLDKDLKPGQLRLLEVDNRVVLPVDTNVRVLLTSYDVIHSWAIPSLGVKTDAIPGRTNETWLKISKPGVYYGQCSEICGIGHGFMPIAIEALSKEDYAIWVENSKQKYAYKQVQIG